MTETNAIKNFYPVLRLDAGAKHSKEQLYKFYRTVIKAVINARDYFAKENQLQDDANLEIAYSSPYFSEFLSDLQKEFELEPVEISVATVTEAEQLEQLDSSVKLSTKIFSPCLSLDLLEYGTGRSEKLKQVPALYTKHDLESLITSQLMQRSGIDTLKIFPVTATSSLELLSFMKSPFTELQDKRHSARIFAIRKELRDKYLQGKGLCNIASPSDYQSVRSAFLQDTDMKLLLVDAEEIKAGDISGMDLLDYLCAEFPDLNIIASGIQDFNDTETLTKLLSKPNLSLASSIFKIPVLRFLHSFDFADEEKAFKELELEMSEELVLFYSLIQEAIPLQSHV